MQSKQNNTKKTSSLKPILNILKLCKKYYFPLVLSIVLALAGVILELVGPNQLSKITNLIKEGLSTGVDTSAVTSIAIVLVIIYVTSAIFTLAEGFIISHITQKIVQKLRTDVSNKINKLPLKTIDKNSKGDILSRITNDADTIGQSLNTSSSSLISAIVLLVGSLVMMLITNWIMALSAVGASVLGFALTGLIIKKSQKYFKLRQEKLGALNGHIEESFSGHDSITTCNAKVNDLRKFNGLNQEVYKADLKSQFLSGFMYPLMSFIGNLGFVVVCIVGSVLLMNDALQVGTIVAFMLYIRFFTQPLGQIAQGITSLQSASAASNRVLEFLNLDEMDNEQNKINSLSNIQGDVEFKNVYFGYNDTPVIKDFSIKIKAGSKVAIVGPTGAGKTTLVNLLMRFYDIDSGEILIDGIPISTMTRETVHNLFSMVLQDTWMFEGSIKENLLFNITNKTDEDVIKACKICEIDNFINNLPNKYDTVIKDDTSISAGQKQLLTIARAMLKDAPLLILDEATSNVDTRTELQLQKSMDKLSEQRTSFVIAHRLSTIKNADLILVVKDGNIIESGKHNELLEKGGFYADLYKSQFTNEINE